MTPDQPMVELPHARIAGGPRTLLVLEGLTLENKAATGRALWLLRWAYKRYTRAFTVYQVGRAAQLTGGRHHPRHGRRLCPVGAGEV
jgi:hypothetical protein